MGLILAWRIGAAAAVIRVDVHGAATVGGLARELAARAPEGTHDAGDLTLSTRTPAGRMRVLDAHARLDDGVLLSGDEVELAAAPPTKAEPTIAATITVTEGADAGATFGLGAGTHVIGRHPDADVRLTDPTVAAHHAQLVVGETVQVRDLGSPHGVVVGARFATRASVDWGQELVLGRSRLVVERAATAGIGAPGGTRAGESPRGSRAIGTVDHTPTARVVPRPEPATLSLPAPPASTRPRQWPLIAMVAPAVMGMGMFAMTGRAMSLMFVVLSPMLAIGSVLDSRRSARNELRRAIDAWHNLYAAAAVAADREQHRLRDAAVAAHPEAAAIAQAVGSRGKLLWCRRREHPEFLAVCLGRGTVSSGITWTQQEAPPQQPMRARGRKARALAAELESAASAVASLREASARVADAPVTVHLPSVGSLGLAGADGAAAARSVVIQLASLHGPADLWLGAACLASSERGRGERGRGEVMASDHAHGWGWMRWLPHASREEPGLVAVASDSVALLVARLERIVEERAGAAIADVAAAQLRPDPGQHASIVATAKDGAESDGAPRPAIVIVVDDDGDHPMRPRLMRLAEVGPGAGIHLIWVARQRAQVPGACRAVAELTGAERGALDLVRGGESIDVAWRLLEGADAERLARELAGVADAGDVAADEAALPERVGLLELHGADAIEPAALLARWELAARGTLRALLGRGVEDPWYLDLVAEGPHALVAGTTGSGKSEFLQAWVFALALAYGPEQVTFLLVDYKGGAAFADCVELPHTVGLVTDLSPALVRRALTSLRAELRHRERLLAATGAKDLDAMAAMDSDGAPARLVIVIDEFATLAAEVPDFIEGVLDIAQRGRSLGLHLVLATQRPSGVVKDNVRANTSIRIALRVADDVDSRDVVGDASAAAIAAVQPGRGVARIGTGQQLPFQAAYPGAHTDLMAAQSALNVRIHDAVHDRWAALAAAEQGPMPPVVGASDASRVVQAAVAAARRSGRRPPRRPWLDALPARVTREECLAEATRAGEPHPEDALVIGLVDDPAHQRRQALTYRPRVEGPLMVVGAPGSGRTGALCAVAEASVAGRDSATSARVYGIDAGNGLAGLCGTAVGGVAHADDEASVARLLAMLAEEQRRRLRAGAEHDPVVLLIDGWTQVLGGWLGEPAAAESLGHLRALLETGRSVGITVAAAADRPGGGQSTLVGLFTRVLALRLSDDAHSSLLGLRGIAPPPDAPPGRGIDPVSRLEFQWCAAAGGHLGAPGRKQAAAIPRLPETVSANDIPPRVGNHLTIGLDTLALRPSGCDPRRSWIVTGAQGSGRSNALRWFATALGADREGPLVLVAPRRSGLAAWQGWDDACVGPDALTEMLARWQPALAAEAEGTRVTLIMERVGDFAGAPGELEVMSLLRRARRLGHVCVAEEEAQGWTTGQLASDLRLLRRGLLMAPEATDAQALLQVSVPRAALGSRHRGAGLWAEGGRGRVVHIPWVEPWSSTDASPCGRHDLAPA